MAKKIKNLPKNNIISKKRNQRITFIALSFLICLAGLSFILVTFKDNIVFFYSPSEFFQTKPSKIIRVGGLVKKDSVILDGKKLSFVISDYENELRITYQGIAPNLFRVGQGIVAKGKFDFEQKVFIAQELLVKHDENYMPPQVKKTLNTQAK